MRRRALAARLADLGVDAVVVTRPVHVRYLTGFTGSNAQVVLTAGAEVFLTDGRYTTQAAHEVAEMDRRTYARDHREATRAFVREQGVGRLGFAAAGLGVSLMRRRPLTGGKADGGLGLTGDGPRPEPDDRVKPGASVADGN